MKELKGTKTEKNLQEAFAGESMARNKYDYWASKAKKDGYVQIAAIFEETAKNEKEHAKMWFKYLEGGAIQPTTANLAAAAAEAGRHQPLYVRKVPLQHLPSVFVPVFPGKLQSLQFSSSNCRK